MDVRNVSFTTIAFSIIGVLTLYRVEACGQYSVKVVAKEGDLVDEERILEMFGEVPLSINDHGQVAYMAILESSGISIVAEEDIAYRERQQFDGWIFPRIDEDDDSYSYRLTNSGDVVFGHSPGLDPGESSPRMVAFNSTLLASNNGGSVGGFDFENVSIYVSEVDGEALFAAFNTADDQTVSAALLSADRVIAEFGDVEGEFPTSIGISFRMNESGDIAYNADAKLVVNDRVVARIGDRIDNTPVTATPRPLDIGDGGDVVFTDNRTIFSLVRGRIVGVGDEIDGHTLTRISEVVAADAERIAFIGEYGNRQWGLFTADDMVLGMGSDVGDTSIGYWFNGPAINARGEIAMQFYLLDDSIVTATASPLIPGDANGDGQVDSKDLNALAVNWQTNGDDWEDGDFNRDSRVDSADLNLLGLHWRTTESHIANAVPEPGVNPVALVLSVALFVIVGRERPSLVNHRR